MNKIVDELVAQVATDSSGKWVAVADLPEFVQLIVRECANYAFSDAQDHRAMLKQFGVEE